MMAILKAIEDGWLKRINPALIIVSNINAEGAQKAIECGIPPENVCFIQRKHFPTEQSFGDAILAEAKATAIKKYPNG